MGVGIERCDEGLPMAGWLRVVSVGLGRRWALAFWQGSLLLMIQRAAEVAIDRAQGVTCV